MPRNKHKTRCQVPGCRNWAMHGHTRCRAHRDAELGPRPVGAPRHNLNALRTGRHARPLPEPELLHLARQIIAEPGLLPYHLGLTAQSLQSRAPDPYHTLLAFRAALAGLQPYVADCLLTAELHHFLRQFPPANRAQVRDIALASLPLGDPERRLRAFRDLVVRVQASLKAQHEAHRRPPPPDDAPFCFPKTPKNNDRNQDPSAPDPDTEDPIPNPEFPMLTIPPISGII